jgi:hypothetical protein
MPGPSLSAWIETARARAGEATLCAAGFGTALAALSAIALGHTWIGLGVLLAGRGIAFAGRRAEQLARAVDPVVFAGVPFAFALADPSHAVAACFLLLAFAAYIATTRRLEGVDEVVALAAFAFACILPERFGLVAYALGIAAFAMAGVRLTRAA